MTEPELEAVLAHEIGHYKKKHILKMLAWSAFSLLGGFYALAWLAEQAWFYRSFGFEPGNLAPAFLLFGLLAGIVTFWFHPLGNFWSRRYEYQADAFAARTMLEPQSLIGALRKLNEKNLSNLTPHPIYSGFFYSHPTLLEREAALTVQKTRPVLDPPPRPRGLRAFRRGSRVVPAAEHARPVTLLSETDRLAFFAHSSRRPALIVFFAVHRIPAGLCCAPFRWQTPRSGSCPGSRLHTQ